MILVVGATGSLGEIICHRLTSANKVVRALVRKSAEPRKLARLSAMGIELVYGDLKDPDSLNRACAGVEAVITTATAIVSRKEGDTIESVDQKGSSALVDAAVAAKVNRFIYLSFPEMPDQFPLQNAKRRVETRLKDSNLDYTILRPTFFMETWLSPAVGFDPINGTAAVFGTGESPVSWISMKDVAEAAVLCLDNSQMKNQVVELGGPEAKSQKEVISAFEAAGIGPVSLSFVPAEFLREKRASALKPDTVADPFQQSIDALMLNVVEGKAVPMKDVLRKMPMELTSIDEYIKTVISSQSN